MNLYEKALVFAAVAHGDQKRKYTNEPYIVHPIAVAVRIRECGYVDDGDVVAAALLHDVLEDTPVTRGMLEREFGYFVSDLVVQVTDVSKPSDGNRRARKAIDREHLRVASMEAQTIKVADILDNLSTIVQYDPEFARVYLSEKRDVLDVLTHADPLLLTEARRRLEL